MYYIHKFGEGQFEMSQLCVLRIARCMFLGKLLIATSAEVTPNGGEQ